jgi:hypothetical protein
METTLENLEMLRDMQKVRPTEFYASLISRMEVQLEPVKPELEWTEAHSRCQSGRERVAEMITNHKTKNGANYHFLKGICELMGELIQESPDDMEERVKALMSEAWANVA